MLEYLINRILMMLHTICVLISSSDNYKFMHIVGVSNSQRASVMALANMIGIFALLQGEWKLDKMMHNGVVVDYHKMALELGLGSSYQYKLHFYLNKLYSGQPNVDYSPSTTWGGTYQICYRGKKLYNIDIHFFKDGPYGQVVGRGVIRIEKEGMYMTLSNDVRTLHADPSAADNTEVRYYTKTR